jgi:hypothetical protein
VSALVKDAVADRVSGDRPSQLRAVAAAIVVGFGAALLTYRLLRSEPEGEDAGEDADAQDETDDAPD